MSDALSILLKNKVNKHTALVSRVTDMMTNLSSSLDFMVKEFKVSEIKGLLNKNKIVYHVEVIHRHPLNCREQDVASILAYEFAELYLLPNAGNVTHIVRSISFKLKEEDASR